MLLATAMWVLCFGFYLLLAGALSRTEIAAAVPVAALAAVFALAANHPGERRFRLNAPWLKIIVMPLVALLPDGLRVGRVLLHAIWQRPQGPFGMTVRQKFSPGGENAGGRRGLVVLATSLAPNGYVLDLREERLLLHRLAPMPPQAETMWPL